VSRARDEEYKHKHTKHAVSRQPSQNRCASASGAGRGKGTSPSRRRRQTHLQDMRPRARGGPMHPVLRRTTGPNNARDNALVDGWRWSDGNCIGGHGLGVCEAKRTSAGCPHGSMCIPGRSVTRESDTCTQDARARAEVLAPPLELPTSRFAVCLAPALRYAKALLYTSASSASVPCCLAPRLERQAWWGM
jgi:hypothetical protein